MIFSSTLAPCKLILCRIVIAVFVNWWCLREKVLCLMMCGLISLEREKRRSKLINFSLHFTFLFTFGYHCTSTAGRMVDLEFTFTAFTSIDKSNSYESSKSYTVRRFLRVLLKQLNDKRSSISRKHSKQAFYSSSLKEIGLHADRW